MIEVPLPNKLKDSKKSRAHRYVKLLTIKEIYGKYIPYTAMALSYKHYRMIIEKYFKYGIDAIYSGLELRVPLLGYFVMYKIPQSVNHKCIDYKETKAANKPIYHDNTHSNGYIYRVRWHKTLGNTTRKYSLILTRTNKELLAKQIKNNTIKI